jgi:hypothetical protein
VSFTTSSSGESETNGAQRLSLEDLTKDTGQKPHSRFDESDSEASFVASDHDNSDDEKSIHSSSTSTSVRKSRPPTAGVVPAFDVSNIEIPTTSIKLWYIN